MYNTRIRIAYRAFPWFEFYLIFKDVLRFMKNKCYVNIYGIEITFQFNKLSAKQQIHLNQTAAIEMLSDYM